MIITDKEIAGAILATMRRIGIYAGTFDPLHDGHIELAKASLHTANLDQVLFLPEKTPRIKQDVTPYIERCEQIEARIVGTAGLSLLKSSFDRFEVHTTMPWLQSLYPDAHLVFLFGSDVVNKMNTWDEIQTMLRDVDLVIGLRDDESKESVENKLATLQEISQTAFHFDIIKTQTSHLSSSIVRNGAVKRT